MYSIYRSYIYLLQISVMDASEATNNNFPWPMGRLPVNPDANSGQLSDDLRSAVQQLFPAGQGPPSAHIPTTPATGAAHVINMGEGGGGIVDLFLALISTSH